MTDRELMQMALDALQESKPIDINDPTAFYRSAHAIEALRAALAQPEREWQGLTDEELRSMCKQTWVFDTIKQWAKIIEAKLREKNT